MDLYTNVAYTLAEKLTRRYSTSFSLSSSLFDKSIRPHIYAIYGMVRIADEIVDTYQGNNAGALLDSFEQEVYSALEQDSPFSTNPIVHAFAVTAKMYSINRELIAPFFSSMRTDLTVHTFTKEAYDEYIYGSAEVIGLMCLKIFTQNSPGLYAELAPSAQALGSAYQKVNFLRDIAADFNERGRFYFPGMTFNTFDDASKKEIESDIRKEFLTGKAGIEKLPGSAKKALSLSYAYYYDLFILLTNRSADDITQSRLRLPSSKKLLLLAREVVKR